MRRARVVKFTALRPGAYEAAQHARYFAERPNEAGLGQQREERGPDPAAPADARAALQAWIERKVAGRERGYSVVLNPGEGRVSRSQIEAWTRSTLERVGLEHGHELDYRFCVHDDHATHTHAHALVYTKEAISKGTVVQARVLAAQSWREVERDFREVPEPVPGSMLSPDRDGGLGHERPEQVPDRGVVAGSASGANRWPGDGAEDAVAASRAGPPVVLGTPTSAPRGGPDHGPELDGFHP